MTNTRFNLQYGTQDVEFARSKNGRIACVALLFYKKNIVIKFNYHIDMTQHLN